MKIAQEKASGEGAIARLNQELQGLNQRKIEQIELAMAKTVIAAPSDGGQKWSFNKRRY